MLSDIIQGVVIGVSSGLILTLYFWLVNIKKFKTDKSNQLKYLISEILKYKKLILDDSFDMNEVIKVKMLSKPTFEQQARWAHLEGFTSKIELIMEKRTSCLTFDEKQEVLDILCQKDVFEQLSKNDKNAVCPDFSKEQCLEIFSKLEAIKWLNLPSLK